MRRRFSRFAQLLALAVAAGATLTYAGTAPAEPAAVNTANGFIIVKTIDPAVCENTITGGHESKYWTRTQCARVDFFVSNTPVSNGTADSVTVAALGTSGNVIASKTAVRRSTTAAVGPLPPTNDAWRAMFSTAGWPAGQVNFRVTANGQDAGTTTPIFVNALGADIAVTPKAG